MPSPLNKLQSSFRQGTQLGRTSLEEATARTGVPAAPTSPLGAAGIGASPDAAKMAGSSAQQNRIALQPSESERLQDVLRRRTMAREETPEEMARRQKAAGFSGLSSLQTRVQDLVTNQFNAAASAAAPILLVDSTKINEISTLTPATRGRLTEIVTAAGTAAGATQAQLAEAATILGIPAKDVDAKLQGLLMSTTIQDAGAAVGDNLLLTDEALLRMGTDAAKVGALLGISETDVRKLTTGGLIAKISLLQQTEFSRVDALRRMVNDPNVGAAERQAAQEQLQEMGAAGVTSTEAAFSRLNNAVDEGDSVTINGETVSVTEALSDKFLSALIKTMIDNADPIAVAKLKAQYPGLAAFIESNKAALKTITDNLATTSATLVATNIAIKDSGNVAGGGSFSPGSMKAGGIDTTGATVYGSPQTTPAIVGLAKNLPDGGLALSQNTNLIEGLSSEDGPGSAIYEIMNASADTLNSSGYADNSDDYYSYLEDFTQLSNSSTTTQILSSVFGDNTTEADLNKEIAFARKMKSLGLADDIDPMFDILDRDKDGKIDDAVSLKESLKNFLTPGGRPMTLSQLVAAGKSIKDLPTPSKIRDSLKKSGISTNHAEGSLVAKYGDYFSDGNIDDKELAVLGNDSTPIEDLTALIKRGVPGSAGIKAILEKRTAAELPKLFDKEGTMKIKAQYAGRGQQTDVDIFDAHALASNGYMMTTGKPDWSNHVSSNWAGNARLYVPALEKFAEKWESIKNDESIPVAVREAFLSKYSQLKLAARKSYDSFLEQMTDARKRDIEKQISEAGAHRDRYPNKYNIKFQTDAIARLQSINVSSEVATRFPADRGKFD